MLGDLRDGALDKLKLQTSNKAWIRRLHLSISVPRSPASFSEARGFPSPSWVG